MKASISHWPFQNTLVLSSGVLLLLWLNCQTVMSVFGANFHILTVTTATEFYFILGWLLVFIISAPLAIHVTMMQKLGVCVLPSFIKIIYICSYITNINLVHDLFPYQLDLQTSPCQLTNQMIKLFFQRISTLFSPQHCFLRFFFSEIHNDIKIFFF